MTIFLSNQTLYFNHGIILCEVSLNPGVGSNFRDKCSMQWVDGKRVCMAGYGMNMQEHLSMRGDRVCVYGGFSWRTIAVWMHEWVWSTV